MATQIVAGDDVGPGSERVQAPDNGLTRTPGNRDIQCGLAIGAHGSDPEDPIIPARIRLDVDRHEDDAGGQAGNS